MDPVELLSQSATLAAPALLGWELVSRSPDGDAGGIIVETEAYMGQDDPASHAFRGRTGRTAPMFEGAGVIYVYRSYGIHFCLNLVTGSQLTAEAVLIRALQPTIGLDLMMARRGHTELRLLASGPGRVGQALGLSTANSGQRLGETVSLYPPAKLAERADIIEATRVGITKATDQHWRFYLKGSHYVSRT